MTPEELEVYERLVEPGENKQQEFQWDENYQRVILATLLADRIFLLQSLDLISPNYFSNRAHSRICKILFEYFREHKSVPPRVIFLKELDKNARDEETKIFYHAELQNVYDSYEEGVQSRDYLRKDISNFARVQALKTAMQKSLDELRRGRPEEETWDRIQSWFRDSLTIDVNFEMGLDYFDTVSERYARMRQERENVEVFTTGFKTLDDSLTSGGMRRGEIYSFMGSPGVGKSLCLVRSSVENIKRGKRVLYISLEMSQDDIATRFDAQLAGVNIRELVENENYVTRSLKEYTEGEDRKLIIKQFPSGTADVNTVRAYLLQLRMIGWEPDLLVVDYIGEMKDVSGIPIYESREKLVKDLRGLGIETNVSVLTAMQPNRSARDVTRDGGIVSDENLGDSYGQFRVLDGLYTINQTDSEKCANVARIFVAKQRAGASRFIVYVDIDPVTLMFSQINEQRYRLRLSQATEKSTVEDKLEKMMVGNRKNDERG